MNAPNPHIAVIVIPALLADQLFVIYLCSGPRRKGDLREQLDSQVVVVLIDIHIHSTHDVSRVDVCRQLVLLARRDECIGVVYTGLVEDGLVELAHTDLPPTPSSTQHDAA